MDPPPLARQKYNFPTELNSQWFDIVTHRWVGPQDFLFLQKQNVDALHTNVDVFPTQRQIKAGRWER